MPQESELRSFSSRAEASVETSGIVLVPGTDAGLELVEASPPRPISSALSASGR